LVVSDPLWIPKTEETVNAVFEVQSEESESIEVIDLTVEYGSKPVKNENLFEDEDDQTISTNKFDQYEEYWLLSPEEINMVESNKNTSTSINMSQQNQYESDDEESDVIVYEEHKNSIELVIPGDLIDKMNIMSITNQHGLTYDVNGIITDGIRKYDKHVWKCYHC
jgi:hypothetical protein